MKDRMIIIREGVAFIITVTHEPEKKQEEPEPEPTTNEQKEVELPYLPISAN